MKFFRSFACAGLAHILCAQIAFGLTVKPNVPPVVSNQIPDQQVYLGTTGIIDVSGFFRDPDASAAARLVTPLGTMNFTLDGETAPATVANFLNYVNSGRYFKTDPTNGALASTFFHRSVANFVVQAGGHLSTIEPSNTGTIQPTQVTPFSAVQNEPFISNVRGTIAMAKVGGDPNSATSQWFINLADNSANLDNQNGGFTVFGRVAGDGMPIADAISALPIYHGPGAFSELPVRDYNSAQAVKVPNLVTIPEFTQISPFTFSASSNNPAVAGVSMSGTSLLVRTGQIGSAQITVTASDLDGAPVSQSFNVNVVAAPGRLLNISTRVNFAQGNEVLIGGFLINGTTPKRLVVRAMGPSLVNQGIPNALTDPKLELRDSSGTLLASNDNWQDGPDHQFLSDFGLAPNENNEAALVTTVTASGAFSGYTAIVRSANGAPGVGLVEVYDLDSAPGSTLLNLSTRGEVGTGSNVLIGGVILRGIDPRRLIFRALGPSLPNQGVSGVLADPTIELHNSQGTLIDSNNDWQTNPNAGEMQGYNLAPDDAKEAACIATLAPGEYTAIISGAGNQPTGVALIEVYQVQ